MPAALRAVTVPDNGAAASSPLVPAYRTDLGQVLKTTVEDALSRSPLSDFEGKVNLIFTSPPFPLNRKKQYGNKTGEDYLKWLSDLAPKLTKLLAKDGSIVVEIGNAWEPGRPVMSTLPLQALFKVLESAKLNLCQQFICHNPARLPSPVQWVNIERIRVKDSFTHVWWMAPTDRPKANNRNVLVEYGDDMKKLLKNKDYNSGTRPSGHRIGKKSFFTDNGGAIPANALVISNTAWCPEYLEYCRENDIKTHPARMRPEMAEFFINFLTDKGDLVLDPFAGSNTTGAVAERLGRKWISIEPREDYVRGSRGRFPKKSFRSVR